MTVKADNGSTAIAVATPADLLATAVAQNADLDKLEKLMELQQRWEADQARKAFNSAFARFRKDCPARIGHDKHVEIKTSKGIIDYTHSTLGEIANTVTPHLCAHGLCYDWRTEQKERGLVTVTCTLSHEAGHSKEVTLSAPPDNSGMKNAIQQVASTVSYLERYTLLAVLGIATAEQDDDGAGRGEFAPVEQKPPPQQRSAPKEPNDTDYQALCKKLREAGTEEDLRLLVKHCSMYTGERAEKLRAEYRDRRRALREEAAFAARDEDDAQADANDEPVEDFDEMDPK